MKAGNSGSIQKSYLRPSRSVIPSRASSPSFGGRGLEVRVAFPRNDPHPSPLPQAGEGNYSRKLRVLFGLRVVVLMAMFLFIVFPGCAKKGPPVSEAEVKAVFEKTLPSAVEDQSWQNVPVHHAKLLLQDVVEPRLMQSSTAFVDVQSVTDGQKIIFRLKWSDPTMNDMPGPGQFGDAVAVQLPAVTAPDVPAPQMGENGKLVEITYWSAIFQACGQWSQGRHPRHLSARQSRSLSLRSGAAQAGFARSARDGQALCSSAQPRKSDGRAANGTCAGSRGGGSGDPLTRRKKPLNR